MKKFFVILFCLLFCLTNFTACGSTSSENVLRICNCEDYIDEDLLSEFEELYDCKIEYSTFGTLENLYNDIKITPDRYDLICPSDYMIEKMAKEGMLKKISFSSDGNYKTYVSPYIADTFEKITWNDGQDKLSDYAACYMWGTLGLTFNPEYVDSVDMESWAALWNTKYKNQSTIKDSIRDSYFMGVAYAYKEELNELASLYESGTISLEEYQAELTKIFNDPSEENVDRVEECLKDLKGNIYGFEVDSGKNDVASGKITINFAWSGDAVYAMDEAETQGVELYYTVPEEGSNVWFDGWCVPKNSQQTELAVKFIEFLSSPEVAVKNMDYIGYTSGIGGQAVYDNAVDWYGVKTLELSSLSVADYENLEEDDKESFVKTADNKIYEYVYIEESMITGNGIDGYTARIKAFDEDTEQVYDDEIEVFRVDLEYFFGEGEWVVYTDTVGRQFSAQYPEYSVIKRCVVMNCYDEEANLRVTLMWERVKGVTFSATALILLTVGIVLIIVGVVLYKNREKFFGKLNKKPRENANRKKYKVVKIEEIN